MNHRLQAIADGVKTIACCCSPRMVLYRVSFFNNDHVWTQVEQMGYSRIDAAKRVNPKLRPGYNCFVVRLIRPQGG